MATPLTPQTYTSYKGLPPLAGLTTFAKASEPGLSVEECVRRLKRFHYAFRRLHEILTARITAEPIYELKTAFAHHAYLCAEHVSALRTRVGEMREPPLGLDEIPDDNLKRFFDEILATPMTEELVVGLYIKAIPALEDALRRYQADTHPLADAPSCRLLRFARLELTDMANFGAKAIACLLDAPQREAIKSWIGLLDQYLGAAGRLDGTQSPTAAPAKGMYSATPYELDLIPKRDERFQDPWNQSVNPEAFLYDDAFEAKPKVLMMLYKRIREIDVPELMATIIHQTQGKPWDYYHDMTRQLWDEARHAMMGEVGFVALGIDWTEARVTHNWSYRLNTECTPIERHAVLYFIEQGLMTKTGKRYEWEVGSESGIPLSRTFQDFDWADEVLHARIGREWYIPEIGDMKKALEYGDECWSRILSNWETVRDQGLTHHENWWPRIYLQACQTWGVEPDPKVLAYDTSYAGARADLKNLPMSG